MYSVSFKVGVMLEDESQHKRDWADRQGDKCMHDCTLGMQGRLVNNERAGV